MQQQQQQQQQTILTPSESTAALLVRLSQRPGVQATLILSRDTGSIVRSSGLITDEEDGDGDGEAARPGSSDPTNGADGETARKGTRRAEDVARLVWRFVQSAGSMIEELNGESDEAKLLRVRTRKNELVIVPGSFNLHNLHGIQLADIECRCKVPPGCHPRYTSCVRHETEHVHRTSMQINPCHSAILPSLAMPNVQEYPPPGSLAALRSDATQNIVDRHGKPVNLRLCGTQKKG
jgi:dynein light chain roadblock-type